MYNALKSLLMSIVLCIFNFLLLCFIADQKRLTFSMEQNMESSNTFHIINRKNIFNNVNSLLLSDGVLSQCPLRVKFEGEAGFDSGGVCRDMFSA